MGKIVFTLPLLCGARRQKIKQLPVLARTLSSKSESQKSELDKFSEELVGSVLSEIGRTDQQSWFELV